MEPISFSIQNISVSLEKIYTAISAPLSAKEWVVALIPIIISVISIVCAICIPNRIMNKQNRIALFEKRYTVYVQLIEVIDFIKSVNEIKSVPNINDPTAYDFSNVIFIVWCLRQEKIRNVYLDYIKTKNEEMLLNDSYKLVNEQCSLLNESEFLYNKKINNFISILSKNYSEYIRNLIVIQSVPILPKDFEENDSNKHILCDSIIKSDSIIKEINKELILF
jgi:hypothetical protein